MTELNETNIMAYANKSPLLLISSAKNNSVESLKYLIKEGYDLTFIDIDNNTILHHIVDMAISEEKIIELIDCVLEKTGESLLDTENKEGLTVLELAKKLECNKVSKHLLLQDSDLHEAVEKGDLVKVKLMLENEIYVGKQNEEGDPPLHIAVKKGNIKMVKLLLEYGAFINSINNYMETPLYNAVEKNNIKMVRFLVENNSVSQAKADINKENEKGDTPLREAVKNNNIEMVRFLVENKADINKENKKGYTPLHKAIENGKIEMVRILLEIGADINKETKKHGDTPLIWGIYNKCSSEIVQLLIENKANINHKNKNKQTALYWACQNKNLEIMKLLLEMGPHSNFV